MKKPKKIRKEQQKLNLFWTNKNGKEYIFHQKNMMEKFFKNNVIIALNALYAKKRKKYCAYISKDNSNREKSRS